VADFEPHPGRGRFNAGFFRAMDGYIDWHLRSHKRTVFAGLPDVVVEIGPGVGANFRYLRPGTKVIAVEPNPYMHRSLRIAAQPGTPTRFVQRAVRRPWSWVFEGCSCERSLETVIRSAGFTSVENRRYRIHSPFLPFNTHIAGTAVV